MNPVDHSADQEVRSLMQALPMSTQTPDALRSRLIDLAAEPSRRARPSRKPLFVLAATGVGVLAVALLTSLPSTAHSWEGIKKAVTGIRTMNLTAADNKGRVRSRVYIDGKVISVVLESGDAMVVTNEFIRTYDRSDNLLFDVVSSEGRQGVDFRSMVLNELSMSTILSQYEEKYGTKNVRLGPVRNTNGRQVYDVTLRDSESPAYGNLVVDAATDLPISLEAFNAQDGKVVKVMELSARFGEAARPLDWSAPPNAKRETIEVGEFMRKNDGKLPKLNFSFSRLLRD